MLLWLIKAWLVKPRVVASETNKTKETEKMLSVLLVTAYQGEAWVPDRK